MPSLNACYALSAPLSSQGEAGQGENVYSDDGKCIDCGCSSRVEGKSRCYEHEMRNNTYSQRWAERQQRE